MPTAGELSKLVNGDFYGNLDTKITSINSIRSATKNDISYACSRNDIPLIKASLSAVIITNSYLSNYCKNNYIVVKNPKVAAAKISQFFSQKKALISANSIIAKTSIIGTNTNIASGCVISSNVAIGDNCYLFPNVVIMENVTIGDNCVISSGAIIGSQGFANALDENKKWHRVHHFGGVKIGNDVTIGANTTIDNGTFNDTIIKDGVRIDNLVHIAHNVIIGENTAIAAKTGIAGSTKIGKNCQIGGMVGIIGHLIITDNVIINATSTVNKNIDRPGTYTGFLPIMKHIKWKKIAYLLLKLDKIIKFLKIKPLKL